MIHVKALMIDDQWSVVGSTNFDYRSFDLNDEVNLAVLDVGLTRSLVEQFRQDLANSREITYAEWSKRTRYALTAKLSGLLERQE
jgi:cardiolipin synthase